MGLNPDQAAFVARVRCGESSAQEACDRLAGASPEAYRNPSFRELLLAVDAINLLTGSEWASVLTRGLVRHSEWLVSGVLDPGAYTEIGGHHERYGRGEYGVALVIDLFEGASRRPNNAESFTRRTLREFFNGVHPVSEHLLFLLKRYYREDRDLGPEDAALLLHINEETKGLSNTRGFARTFVTLLVRAAMDEPATQRVIISTLRRTDEVTDRERMLIDALKNSGIQLPSDVLEHVDLSMDRLTGML